MAEDSGNNDNYADSFQPWAADMRLAEISERTVRYSHGLLQLNPRLLFPAIDTAWVSLLSTLDLQVELSDVKWAFSFPGGLERVVGVEVNGEPALIGYDAVSGKILADILVPGGGGAARARLLEYVEHRIVSTLKKCWDGVQALDVTYAPQVYPRGVTVEAAVSITLLFRNEPCVIWFGIGPRLAEQLDASWRSKLINRPTEFSWLEDRSARDSLFSVNVNLLDLAIEPSLLIDYLRTGSIIDLETPITDQVSLRVNGQPWGIGALRQHHGKFVAEIMDFQYEPLELPPSTTCVSVELAYLEVDWETIRENSQRGAMFPVGTALDAEVSIVISGESVATAVVGEINGRFALNILPK